MAFGMIPARPFASTRGKAFSSRTARAIPARGAGAGAGLGREKDTGGRNGSYSWH